MTWRVPVLCLALLIPLTISARELTFEERVACHEAIERAYYTHRTGATEPFETAIPRATVESTVRDSLEQSAALEKLWSVPLTAIALDDEMRRIAGGTQMPGRLVEIYHALGDDPVLVLECLARPILVNRRLRELFSVDQTIHGAARDEAELLRRELVWGDVDVAVERPDREVSETPTEVEARLPGTEALVRDGDVGEVLERPDAFVIPVRLASDLGTLRVAWYRVDKRSFEDWWKRTRGASAETGARTVASPDAELVMPAGWAGEKATPPSDVWTAMTTVGAPLARRNHTMVWTGNYLVVWGGYNDFVPPRVLKTGGRYDPMTDSWEPTSTVNALTPKVFATAIWTGDEMVVWGGYPPDRRGGRYDPRLDRWKSVSQFGAPGGRYDHTAVWTGTEMLVWGGFDNESRYWNDGGAYDPLRNGWRPLSVVGAPSGRSRHAAVWTGERMIVWGGSDGSRFDTGGRYDPAANTWAPMTTTGAPSPRTELTAEWTGRHMEIWGGNVLGGFTVSGGQYDPVSDTWSATTWDPHARFGFTTVWTGREILAWGGWYIGSYLNTGFRYEPERQTSTPMSTANAPRGRLGHKAVWTGESMMIWGGSDGPSLLDSGGTYHVAQPNGRQRFGQPDRYELRRSKGR